MDEGLIGAAVLAIVMISTGAMCVVIGQRGAAGRLDYSWGGHTRDNTPPDIWRQAHAEAGPRMSRMGWLFVFAGLVAPLLIIATWENAAVVVLVTCCLIGIAVMFRGLMAGLRVLADKG